ncbi:MAG: hypothetical protein GWO20_12810, partial [Candidatus Korarchaeota archaeon]|nr:hypothetical protein [Candidatus Korarchaeota archaeon]NIW52502.1 hypothetical protein [Candidatus Korarchaeota archaeon]
MIYTKSTKLVQCISVALISLMLTSAFISTAKSQEEYFSLWACLSPEVPMGGYSGGGHPIMYMMDPILEDLGIGLDIFIQGDPWANW